MFMLEVSAHRATLVTRYRKIDRKLTDARAVAAAAAEAAVLVVVVMVVVVVVVVTMSTART